MAAKVIQAVRAHVPLIKFSPRLALGSEVPAAAATIPTPFPQAISKFPTASNEILPPQKQATSGIPKWKADEQPVGKTPRGSGLEFLDLPDKYKRPLIDEEEIGYILRGGPE